MNVSAQMIAVLMAGLAMLTSIPLSYAHNGTGLPVPSECNTFEDNSNTDHSLTVLTSPPYVPSTDVDIEAHKGDGAMADRVQIVAVLTHGGVASVIHNDVHDMSTPSATITDVIHIPLTAQSGDQVDIFACFERSKSGVTHHLDVATIFVLPESAIGTIALLGSSLATFGGYTFLKSRKSV